MSAASWEHFLRTKVTDQIAMADLFWCMMGAQRGWSVEETANKLLEVSARAQGRARLHDEGYALITAQNAAAAAAQGRQAGVSAKDISTDSPDCLCYCF